MTRPSDKQWVGDSEAVEKTKERLEHVWRRQDLVTLTLKEFQVAGMAEAKALSQVE